MGTLYLGASCGRYSPLLSSGQSLYLVTNTACTSKCLKIDALQTERGLSETLNSCFFENVYTWKIKDQYGILYNNFSKPHIFKYDRDWLKSVMIMVQRERQNVKKKPKYEGGCRAYSQR